MTVPTVEQPSAQRNTLVGVAGILGYWATKTGGDVESDTSNVFDGGALTPQPLAAPPVTSNWVIGRPYKPRRDQDLARKLRPLVGSWITTLSEQDTDANLQPIGKPAVAPNALLVAVRAPETDASSGDSKMIELEFAVPRVV